MEIEGTQEAIKLLGVIDSPVKWSEEWQLFLSESKTFRMRIAQSLTPINYPINSSSMATVNEAKDLGFRYTDPLNFRPSYKLFRAAFTRTYHIFKALARIALFSLRLTKPIFVKFWNGYFFSSPTKNITLPESILSGTITLNCQI